MIVTLILAALSVTPAYTNVNRAGGAKLMTNIVEWADAVESAIEAVPSGTARPLPRYLHALDFCDSYANDAAWYYAQPQDYGACSAVRDGGFLYRNYDWKFDETAEFVVRMTEGPGRFASIGVANCSTNLTEDVVTSGKASRYYKCLPGRVVDGINENGVVCEVTVVGGEPPPGTGGDIHPLAAVRWALDNGTSAGMVASNLADRIAFPDGWTQNFHWMVADERETWIVENGACSNVAGRAVMTNFQIIPTPTEGEGWERYQSLADGANITSQWWTAAYDRNTLPVRYSDLGTNYESIWDRWDEKPKEAHRGETYAGQTWWQTVHTSVYDVSNRTLRVAVQEQDDWYTFSVPSAGGVKPEAVKEIVEPMIGAATNELAKTRLPSWLTAKSDEPRGKTDLDVYEQIIEYSEFTYSSDIDGLVSAIGTTQPEFSYGSWVFMRTFQVGGHVYSVKIDSGTGDELSLTLGVEWEAGPGTVGHLTMTRTKESVKVPVGKLSHVKDAGGSLPSGIAKLGDGGEMTAATPSSTGGADADYRDPQDNTCHKTELTEWTFSGADYDPTKNYRVTEAFLVGHWFYDLYIGNISIARYETDDDVRMTSIDRFASDDSGEIMNFTATRTAVCTSNETFVTKSFVTNETAKVAASAVSPSAVTNIINEKVSANLNTYVDGETGVEYVVRMYGKNAYFIPTGNVYPPNE